MGFDNEAQDRLYASPDPPCRACGQATDADSLRFNQMFCADSARSGPVWRGMKTRHEICGTCRQFLPRRQMHDEVARFLVEAKALTESAGRAHYVASLSIDLDPPTGRQRRYC